MSRVIGHQKIRGRLRRLVSTRQLAPSSIFAGPRGVGKRLVAEELSAMILCSAEGDRPCGRCRGCIEFSHQRHPDLHRLACEVDGSVEAVRGLLHRLSLRPFHGGARVVIIDNAEEMTMQAANALLKTLEEPPRDCYFFLVSAAPSRLPATIRSRCQLWFFSELSQDDVSQIVDRSGERFADLRALSAVERALLCDGNLDGAEHVAKHLGPFREVQRSLVLLAEGDLHAGIQLATAAHKDKELTPVYVECVRIIARAKMREAGSAEKRLAYATLLENAIAAQSLCEGRNINAQYVLAAVFQLFVSVLHEGAVGVKSLEQVVSE